MATRTNPDAALSSLRLRPRIALLACAALLAGGCHRNGANEAIADFSAQPEAVANAAVKSVVNSAVMTDRLATSTLERKQATPGNRFVVLDVTARNTDRQPQVFSEGKLVNVSESRERTFATPVSMLTGEYLTLQVLNPSSSVHGKIAYEVPEELPGVLYWMPGNGNERILLHVAATTTPVTSAHAEADAGIAQRYADDSASSTPPAIERPARRTVTAIAATPPGRSPATAETRVASITPPPAPSVPASNEQARRLACGALVSRNDPAEKTRYLAFFSRECEGYAMPPAWMSEVAATSTPSHAEPSQAEASHDAASHVAPSHFEPVDAPRWPPRPGPAFDCNQAYSRAEHLVCEDAVLSLMDWELTRAYANASHRVDDPTALQRDEDDWRHRVRDACDTSRCIESAYNQRTAVLEAVAQGR